MEAGADLTVFEIDRGFVQLLTSYFGSYHSFHLIEGDVLKTWKAEYQRHAPKAFFGNLPYNIAAKLIAATIEAECFFDRMVITVQKEVGLRMTAAPGSADYSSFSVLCQWAYDVEPIRDIAPAKKQSPQPVRDARLFLSLVRGLFSSRRKTVKNNLSTILAARGKKMLPAESLLKAAEIDPAARAESLTVYDFIRLSDTLCDV